MMSLRLESYEGSRFFKYSNNSKGTYLAKANGKLILSKVIEILNAGWWKSWKTKPRKKEKLWLVFLKSYHWVRWESLTRRNICAKNFSEKKWRRMKSNLHVKGADMGGGPWNKGGLYAVVVFKPMESHRNEFTKRLNAYCIVGKAFCKSQLS